MQLQVLLLSEEASSSVTKTILLFKYFYEGL